MSKWAKYCRAFLLALASAGLASTASAGLVVSIVNNPAGPTVQGGSGSFDLVVKDTGGGSISLNSYQIEFTVPSGIDITSITSTGGTNPYVFTSVPGYDPTGYGAGGANSNDVAVLDGAGGSNFQTLNTGDVYTLAHVAYSVEGVGSSTVGSNALTFYSDTSGPSSLATQFVDPTTTVIPFTIDPTGPSITVTAAPTGVPLPAAAFAAPLGIAIAGMFASRSRKLLA